MATTNYSTTTTHYEEQPLAMTTTETHTTSMTGSMMQSGAMTTQSGSMSMGAARAMHGSSRQLVSGSSYNGGHITSTGIIHAQGAMVGGGHIISTVRGDARETGETHVIATRTGEGRFTGEVRVVDQYQSGSHVVDTRVVGVEKGIERQVSITEVAIGEEVIGERTAATGRMGRRGKKVIREEVIERIVVVPETIQIEEWVEDEYEMEETVIEVAKKFQIEKIVEVPEIEIVERVIEQIEKVIREKVIEVPIVQTIERIVEIPVIQTVERIVEVHEIQYNDVPVERIVEVPEYRTEEVIREVKRPHFVDKMIDQKRLVADAKVHKRKLPVPVEAEVVVEFTVPHLRANYIKKKFPVYLPRFIEVPVSRQFIEAGAAAENDKYCARLRNLSSAATAVSLCEIEKLATEFKTFESRNHFSSAKITNGASVDESTKRNMFRQVGHSLERHAVYAHLPIDISDVHMGHYHLDTSGGCMTYSSATFGSRSMASTTSAAVGYQQYQTTTQALPMNATYSTTQYSAQY